MRKKKKIKNRTGNTWQSTALRDVEPAGNWLKWQWSKQRLILAGLGKVVLIIDLGLSSITMIT